jgi:putative DNA base modification enzyme with NMAD domain
MAAFLANVGVNAGHAARSPLFPDGSFELVPIPESVRWRRPMVRFADLDRSVPAAWRDRAAHLDPDLDSASPSYGDNCRTAGRAYSLRRAEPGDLIAFLARLHGASPSFYLIGCLVVDAVLADVVSDPGAGWWDGNAHVRRGRAHHAWNGFWVFKGGSGTRTFERARRFSRDEAARVFGDGWLWRSGRTELQTIGSYTRAIRRVEGDGEQWLRDICLS